TMDTFVDSSWYMYRYLDPKFAAAFMDKDLGRKWLPVHQYTGGIEHAILHLLYMRFVCKALRDLGELWFDEPALRLRNQGTIIFGDRGHDGAVKCAAACERTESRGRGRQADLAARPVRSAHRRGAVAPTRWDRNGPSSDLAGLRRHACRGRRDHARHPDRWQGSRADPGAGRDVDSPSGGARACEPKGPRGADGTRCRPSRRRARSNRQHRHAATVVTAEIRLAALCDHALVGQDGKVSLLGIFRNISV